MTAQPYAGLLERLQDKRFASGEMFEAAEAISSLLNALERAQETIVDLWHDSASDPRPLHECLGMTGEEYQAWANPSALNSGASTQTVGGE